MTKDSLADDSPPDITILLPAYDEEAAIGSVIDEVRATMDIVARPYEILVIDDASMDRTAEIAEQHGARVIRRPDNGGSGAARRTGIRKARGEVIVMLDADGTYPATSIPELLERMDRYEQVNGARTSEQGTLKWLRVPAKWAIRSLASYLVGRSIPDLNTGLKCFRRKTMLRYLHLIPDGFSCVTTMTLAYLTNDHPTAYVPVPYRPRIGHSKFHPIRDTTQYILAVLRMVLYFKPLKIFLPLGLTLIVGSTWLAVYHRVVEGGLQQSDVVMLLVAMTTLALGLIADLIVVHARRPAVDDD